MSLIADTDVPPDSVVTAAGTTFRLAGPADNDALARLLAEGAMDSWIRLSLERRPDYFAADHLMGESRTVIGRRTEAPFEAMGMFSCRCLPVHVNGAVARGLYLGELRIGRAHRSRIRAIRAGFASIAALMPDEWRGFPWFTSIASGNRGARRLLERGLPGMPCYAPLGEIESLAFSTRLGRADPSWGPARRDDIPAIVECFNEHAAAWQFSTALDETWLATLDGSNGLRLEDVLVLRDAGGVAGCVAVWDQRAFKQVIVRGYRPPVGALRGAYNAWARVARRPWLPGAGERLDQAFLAFFAVDARARAMAVSGVRSALAVAAAKGASVGVLGLSTRNPLRGVLKSRLPGSGYLTCIESVTSAGAQSPFLDGRRPQPEIAVL